MTSWNYGRFLPHAIESVLQQSFSDFELIVVDDGSSDISRDIIRDFQKRDDRIRTLYHGQNMGIARSTNDGLDMARGTFLASIDADDIWMADKLKKQLGILSRNEDLVVWSDGLVIDAKGAPTGETFIGIVPGAVKKHMSGNIFGDLLSGNFINNSARILKRENIGNIRWNEDLVYLNDYQFAVDLAYRYDYFFIEEPLTCYRIHGKNTLTRDPDGIIQDLQKLYAYFLARYGTDISQVKRYEVLIRYYREMFREYQVRRVTKRLMIRHR